MKDHNQHEIQMSEAFLNSAFLALSGGFQDAYTYNARNEVFCNAQTGNVVLMSQHFMAGELTAGLGYFFPIIFFALGVWVAEKIQANYKYAQKLHWPYVCLGCRHWWKSVHTLWNQNDLGFLWIPYDQLSVDVYRKI